MGRGGTGAHLSTMERAAAAINDAGVDVTNENGNSGGDGGGAGIDVDGADAGGRAGIGIDVVSLFFFSSSRGIQALAALWLLIVQR